jgi:hypothetical protein
MEFCRGVADGIGGCEAAIIFVVVSLPLWPGEEVWLAAQH